MTATPRARHRLRKLRVDRVDLVPEGAQPDAAILIAKARDEFEAEVAKHMTGTVSRPVAVAKALDARPDLYEQARAAGGTTARVVKIDGRPTTLRERITAHVEGEARSLVSKSAGVATRTAVAGAVVKLLDDPGLAELAALGSMPQAVLPVEVAVKQLRAFGLVSVDAALARLGL